MSFRPNIVITGVGVVCPIGIGHQSYWSSLCEQKCSVETMPELVEADFPVKIGARITDFEPKKLVKPRKALKVMSREIQVGFSAAAMATQYAQLSTENTDPERMGVLFGGQMQYCHPGDLADVYRRCIDDGEFDFSRWGDAVFSQINPLWMLMYLPNMIACHIGIAHDARGPNNTISVGDASSLLAIIEAADIIQSGRADAMIAGGSSSQLSLTPMMYRGALNLSRNNASPATACRPFDLDRNGTVNGEGGAAFVLESAQHAQARGAKVLARMAGWGTAYESAELDPARRVRCIRRSFDVALKRADLQPSDIGHVNAHAAGLVEDDSIEAQAIQNVLGDVPVTAPKSFFGNVGSAGGAVEMVASLLAIIHSEIPVTLNYEKPDPRCPVQVVHERGQHIEQPSGLVLSQSSTGQSAAVVLTR